MNRYFVVLPDGQRYGPATPEHLSDWVIEGRVLPNTVLEDHLTGQRLLAGQVPGLPFGQTAPQPQAAPTVMQQQAQQQSHYPVHHQPYAQAPWPDPYPVSDAPAPVWCFVTFILSAISFFGCGSVFGLLTAGGAVACGVVSRSRREKGAGCALTFAVVALFAVALSFMVARMIQAGAAGVSG